MSIGTESLGERPSGKMGNRFLEAGLWTTVRRTVGRSPTDFPGKMLPEGRVLSVPGIAKRMRFMLTGGEWRSEQKRVSNLVSLRVNAECHGVLITENSPPSLSCPNSRRASATRRSP